MTRASGAQSSWPSQVTMLATIAGCGSVLRRSRIRLVLSGQVMFRHAMIHQLAFHLPRLKTHVGFIASRRRRQPVIAASRATTNRARVDRAPADRSFRGGFIRHRTPRRRCFGSRACTRAIAHVRQTAMAWSFQTIRTNSATARSVGLARNTAAVSIANAKKTISVAPNVMMDFHTGLLTANAKPKMANLAGTRDGHST